MAKPDWSGPFFKEPKPEKGRSRPLPRTSEKQALLDARWAGVKDGMLFMARKLDPDGPSCEECGVRGNKDTLDLHHLRSRAQGGSYEARNGMLVCRPCHQRLTGGISFSSQTRDRL